jgi:single-stranded DNA-binding protein
MNTCALSGRLTRNAVVAGKETKAMSFTLACKHGYDSKTKEERVEFVPCVLFQPSDAIAARLSDSGKGVFIELKGRVATSNYESDGERRFKTEVIVESRSLNFVSGNGKK